jgi:hypothetical protein
MNIIKLRWISKVVAGLLLIAATAIAVQTILAYFPNKMPAPGKGENAWYTGPRFKMTLIEDIDSTAENKVKLQAKLTSLSKNQELIKKEIDQKKSKSPVDTAYKKDSVVLKLTSDSITLIQKKIQETGSRATDVNADGNRIHLNTILLILVAGMGFLGSMVHVASSFTSFVGNGTFENRWILWYFVKPFTAAGLAVIIYFVIRAGFMGYGSDASSVNLYGILALSALAGLFTDNATLKLKEVFDVVFKPKDERSDRLTDFKLKITSVTPAKIDVDNPNNISIKGENFDKKKIVVKINGRIIPKPTITSDTIDFVFTVDATDKQKSEFDLLITDEAGKELYKTTLKV